MATLTDAGYNKLVSQLKRLLTSAKSAKPVDQALLQAYWSIGKRIVQTEVLDDAAYGDSVIRNLSEDIGIDVRSLQRAVVFSTEYTEVPTTGLSWAHYRQLLTLSDPEERSFYEQLALEEGLSRDRLIFAIDSDVYSQKNKAKRKVKLRRPADTRYLFEAELLRFVDGDTLLVELDLGFGVKKEQRLRLASVNTFSPESKKGREATNFVAKRLTLADRIVLRTQRADLHGRYLAHVFYSTKGLDFVETFEQGHYLNQELLDEKLAMKDR